MREGSEKDRYEKFVQRNILAAKNFNERRNNVRKWIYEMVLLVSLVYNKLLAQWLEVEYIKK